MKELFLLLLSLTTFGCTNLNKKEKIESPVIKIDSIKSKTSSVRENKKSITTEQEKEITDTGLSFHKWYLKVTNDFNSKVPIDFVVTRGKDDNCLIDYVPYFDELRKLGTISNSFIAKEKERTRPCAETISKMKWSEYGDGIPENCDDYMYWTNSQDITDGVELIKVDKRNNHWNVEMFLYNNGQNQEKIFTNRVLNAIVINENGKFLIDEIKWIK